MYVNQEDGSNETHIWKLLAALLAFTLIAAACGDDDDVTLLLVEQNADMALAHCKRFCVIRKALQTTTWTTRPLCSRPTSASEKT